MVRGLRAGLLFAGILGCEPKADTGDSAAPIETAADTAEDTAEDWSFSAYDGRLEYKIALDDPSITQCDLFWVFLGEPATPCPECVFAFTLNMVYDAASSDNAAGCVSDAATANFSWTLGYDEGYAETTAPVMWLYDPEGATWAPAFEVSLDTASGALGFQTSFSEAIDQDTTIYYTVIGEGTLQRASSARFSKRRGG